MEDSRVDELEELYEERDAIEAQIRHAEQGFLTAENVDAWAVLLVSLGQIHAALEDDIRELVTGWSGR